jgi:hypothetical protein
VAITTGVTLSAEAAGHAEQTPVALQVFPNPQGEEFPS